MLFDFAIRFETLFIYNKKGRSNTEELCLQYYFALNIAKLPGEPQVPLARPPTCARQGMLSRDPSYLSQGLRPRTPALYFIESN
jgi:hypothetical protein